MKSLVWNVQACLSFLASGPALGGRYIFAIVHAFEANVADGFISARARAFKALGPGGHSEHAPARGQDAALLVAHRPRVKDRDVFHRAGLVESRDVPALLVNARIAFGCRDDA